MLHTPAWPIALTPLLRNSPSRESCVRDAKDKIKTGQKSHRSVGDHLQLEDADERKGGRTAMLFSDTIPVSRLAVSF